MPNSAFRFLLVALLLIVVACKPTGTSLQKGDAIADTKGGDPKLTPQQLAEQDKLFFEAISKQAQQKPEQALVEFKNVLKINPQHAASLYGMAQIYLEFGQMDQALECAELALKYDNTNYWYYRILAFVQEEAKMLKDAILTYQEGIKQFPKDVDFRLNLAEVYKQTGQLEPALKIYQELASFEGMEEHALYEQFRVHDMRNDKANTILTLEKLIKLAPSNPLYYEMLYKYYLAQSQPEKGKDVLESLLALEPENPFALIELISYYQAFGPADNALPLIDKIFASEAVSPQDKVKFIFSQIGNGNDPEVLKKALGWTAILIKSDPGSPIYYGLKGDIHANMGELDSARVNYKKAVAIDDSNPMIWEHLLNVNAELGQYDSLVVDSRLALDVFPNNLLFLYLNGLASYQIKEYTGAIQSFERVLKIGTSDKGLVVEVHTLLGDAYHYIKNFKKSDQNYNSALKIDPQNTLTLNNYAYFLAVRKEKLDTALVMAKKVLKMEPNEPSYQDTYGWVLFQMGNYTEALTWLEKAYATAPDSPDIAEHLGDVYYKLGNPDKAIELWKVAQKKGGTSPMLTQKIAKGVLE